MEICERWEVPFTTRCEAFTIMAVAAANDSLVEFHVNLAPDNMSGYVVVNDTNEQQLDKILRLSKKICTGLREEFVEQDSTKE